MKRLFKPIFNFQYYCKNGKLNTNLLNLWNVQKRFGNIFQVIGNIEMYKILKFCISNNSPFYNIEKIKKILFYCSNSYEKKKLFSYIRRAVKKPNIINFLNKVSKQDTNDKLENFLRKYFGNYPARRFGIQSFQERKYFLKKNFRGLKKPVLTCNVQFGK